MGRINVLSKETANLIAAGEVVERPSSIVKELVENAFDAGASAVTVEIRSGGIQMVRVTDNGCGMAEEDALACFKSHATSKMRDAQELDHIRTMGFRGEALASIAAVSRVTLRTRMQDSDIGTQVRMEGGTLITKEEAGCPEGTTLIVEDLFYNTPARLKFLKQPRSEAGYVSDLIARLILTHPEIALKFIVDGRLIYHSPGDGDLKSAVYTVYGREGATGVLPVALKDSGISISGYVGLPSLARGNRARETFIVNGRYVRDAILANAVETAYDTRLMINRFPFFVLCIVVEPEELDVNVHPNKLEVRFRNLDVVRAQVHSAVASALQAQTEAARPRLQPQPEAELPKGTWIPSRRDEVQDKRQGKQTTQAKNRQEPAPLGERPAPFTPQMPPKREYNRDSTLHLAELLKQNISARTGSAKTSLGEGNGPDISIMKDRAEVPRHDAAPERALQQEQVILTPEPDGKDATTVLEPTVSERSRLIGTAFETYIILEMDKRILMIDQHAAHERLLYEKYTAQIEAQQVAKQPLLVPAVVNLTPSDKVRLLEKQDWFSQLGFEIEDFGDDAIQIRTVPLVMGNPQPQSFFNELLDRSDDLRVRAPLDLKRDRIAQMACKHAIKAGDSLSQEEINALLALIEKEKTPLTCPHGRPIFIAITKSELEKRFGRIQ